MNNSEIFLDTSALIPLLTPEHKNHKIVRRFVSGFKVFCIDSVVLSEYLAGISRGDMQKCADVIKKQFQICSLTPKGSHIAAVIYKICKEHGVIPTSKSEHQISRVDVYILAVAIECKASTFLYEDKHFNLMAEALKKEKNLEFKLPVFQQVNCIQQELFDI